MSLWAVPDRQAKQWMTTFYEAKLRGQPVLEAARSARLAVLQQVREQGFPDHPFLWGGFVTAGDWQ